MRRAGWLAAATATALAVTVVVVAGDEGPPAPPPWPPLGDGILAAGSGLQPFDDCEPLVDHLRAAALHDPSGAGGFFFRDEAVALEAAPADGDAAAGAATTADSARLSGTSDTNVQVAGVDEPDLTETDGRRLFTVSEGTLHVVDVSGPQPQRLSSTPLDVDHGEGQLVLDGDRLLVIAPRWGDLAVPDPAAAGEPAADLSMPEHGSALTTILVFDVSRDDPRLVGRTDLEGTHVAGRAVDGTAHLVVAHRPNPIPMPLMEEVWQARSEAEAQSRLAAALDDTTAEDWLPVLQHQDADGVVTTRPTLECTDVARAAEEPGTGTLQVVTLDLHGDDALPEGTTAVLTDAQTVTASADQLVVATTRWNDLDQPEPAAEPAFDVAPAPQHADTLLHLFELAPTGATHLASGEAPGTLLNQFSMSLHDGHLRVATTAGDAWGGDSESGVTILRRDGDTLETVGQVAGLGRGETIHSVRFLGDRGYVVTFRQTDPLYSLDLSDPADPRVTGELKITGYSAYLHPMPDDRLLGIGQEATLEGRVTGTQVSMFDVSDPADPRRESQVHLPGASSEAEWDHHAVLVHDGTLVLPYERWGEPTEDRPEGVDVGAVVVDVDGPLEVRGTLRPDPDLDPEVLRETGGWQPPIRRVLVVDGRILTLTQDGTLTAWDSATLQATGTLPL